ncbi:hypothetical protein TNCV_2449061 [Trichonephila clavipes]|uniref:Uncharacterized protein n=1 Tax=Trichonephila clavipes TaxID=2585209 RepID=A0A8X6SJR0_TRICX|nr:hypothetical protein TNCV_2449061 [Trichonephila clavipes]
MVMSETHSEKRKFGKAGESSVNKESQKRSFKKSMGKFTEDCIPDGVFPIEMMFFVFLQAPIMIPHQYNKTFQEIWQKHTTQLPRE